ncbi:MAG TPA: MauE/DoxX family redox-associated membrane protein [Chloroflexota bacterium]|nr:MauE/DoxX family redox-associated membrane protein [Chloroflexota bacterium]
MPTMARFWPYLTVGFRLFLATVFFVAGGSKVVQLWAFVHTVEGYHMLPEALARPFGLALPWIELLLGLYLLLGLFIRVTAAVTAAVLGMFLLALATQIARGHTGNCGCVVGLNNPIINVFIGGDSIGAWDIVRDGILLLMAAALALTSNPAFTVDRWMAARRGDSGDEHYDAPAGISQDARR